MYTNENFIYRSFNVSETMKFITVAHDQAHRHALLVVVPKPSLAQKLLGLLPPTRRTHINHVHIRIKIPTQQLQYPPPHPLSPIPWPHDDIVHRRHLANERSE
jgi:hypothetical protein